MKKMWISLTAVLMLTLMVLAGCGGAGGSSGSSGGSGNTPAAAGTAPSEAAPARDTIKVAMKSELSTMDPYNNSVTVDRAARANWYETLLVYYKGQFEPLLCEKYSISQDGLTYTFNLKQGVKFHDGSLLTAEDVAYSLQKGLTAASYATEATYVNEVRVKDANTVEVELKQIYAPFLLAVGTKVCIINKAHMEAKGDQAGYNEPIGTGPYRLTERVAGQKLVAEAFAEWHGGSTALKKAEFVVIADPTSAQMALESREVDLTYILPSIAVKSIESNPDFKLEKVTALGCGYLVYNLEKYPFNDVNFRQALAHSIDRDKIIASALDGVPNRATNLWNEEFVGYTGNTNFDEVDLEKAKEYLAQSGYKGESISFTIGNETYKRIAVIMQEDLRKVGINVDVQQVEINSWIDDMTKGNFGMAFINEAVEADVGMWTHVLSSGGIGVLNMSRLAVPEIDEAFVKGASTNDLAERQKYYDQIGSYLKDQAIVVPVYYPTMTPAYDKNLTVKRIYADGYARLCDIRWNS